MDERTRHAVRLMCDAAHEMRRQHELQTVLIDRLCVDADALVEMAEGEHPSGASRLPRVMDLLAAPPLVSCLLAHPGSDADVVPRRTLGAGHADPSVEAGCLGSDGCDALRDLVEGVLLLPGGDGGDECASSEGFYGYVGEVHASTMPDAPASRQELLTDHPGSTEQVQS